MIKYSLQCPEGHRFDSWFADGAAYDKLVSAGHVACAICGNTRVEKSIMAPRIGTGDSTAPSGSPDAGEATPAGPLSQPLSPAEQAIAALKKKVEETSDYVGGDFVKEARAIHEGTAPSRAIHGEAKLADAKKLLEEGVPVAPLPFTPQRKTN